MNFAKMILLVILMVSSRTVLGSDTELDFEGANDLEVLGREARYMCDCCSEDPDELPPPPSNCGPTSQCPALRLDKVTIEALIQQLAKEILPKLEAAVKQTTKDKEAKSGSAPKGGRLNLEGRRSQQDEVASDLKNVHSSRGRSGYRSSWTSERD